MDICRIEAALAESERGGGATTTQRVLVVEDESLVAVEMEHWLLEAGHEVVGVVNNANAAINVAKKMQPDLIVMDIRLAGHKDGVYAAQRIYNSLGIRCLFSSAYADDWTRLRAEPAKPLGWLGKPYGRVEFMRALGQAVDQLGHRPSS